MLPSNFRVPFRKFPTESWPFTTTDPYGSTFTIPVISITFTLAVKIEPKVPVALNPKQQHSFTFICPSKLRVKFQYIEVFKQKLPKFILMRPPTRNVLSYVKRPQVCRGISLFPISSRSNFLKILSVLLLRFNLLLKSEYCKTVTWSSRKLI